MNGAFEDAFYQLDKNRDGVVTLADLQRYVEENHLKDKFIQKWLTLFGDEKNVIYYDKFCETMGIVPAVEKFEQKTYKIDMSEDTRKEVTDVINEFLLNDSELTEETLDEIKERLATQLGDSWNIKINPSKPDLNVDYESDGYLYYSPNNTELPKILVYRELQEIPPTTVVYKKDMSEDTEKSIQNIITDHILNNGAIENQNLNDLIDTFEKTFGDKWGIVLNPTSEEVDVPYEEDGILYYSLDSTEYPKILVWRKAPEDDKREPKIIEIDMTEETKKFITDTVEGYLANDEKLADDTLNALTRKLSVMLGDKWKVIKDPSENDLGAKYAPDGYLYYSPNASETQTLLVYRENKGSDKEIIYDAIMSDSVKEGILKIVRRNYNPEIDKLPKVEIIIKHLNEIYGTTWNVKLNPSTKALNVDYDFDGKIYFSPNQKEDMKLLIWRKDKEKNRGKMCFCCF